MNFTESQIAQEIELLKKQEPKVTLPEHLWVALAKNSLRQKFSGFTVCEIIPV